MYQAFRRSSPQGKNGLWSRVLVVRDNDRAKQMAELFAEGDPDYLTDERWWQLVQEQDKEVLGDTGGDKGDTPIPPGFLGGVGPAPGAPATPAPAPNQQPQPAPAPPPAPVRQQLHELTRKYVHPTFRVEYDIQAFAVEAGDVDLRGGLPWVLKLDDVATRTYGFLVDTTHDVFRSTTMTPLDGLLTELTHRTTPRLSAIRNDRAHNRPADRRHSRNWQAEPLRLDALPQTKASGHTVRNISLESVRQKVSLRAPPGRHAVRNPREPMRPILLTAADGFGLVCPVRISKFGFSSSIRSFCMPCHPYREST